MHQSHKPSESGTADWLMESKERLRLAMREFVAMWGDVKEYIGDCLYEMAGAAIRRAKEILADVAAGMHQELPSETRKRKNTRPNSGTLLKALQIPY